jgi:Ca2+-binding RTX toxin-like protein
MLAAPPAAPALTTCAYNATDDTLRVSLPLALDDAILEAIGGNVVVKRAFGIPVDSTGSATPPASAEHDLRERHESSGHFVSLRGPENLLNGDIEAENFGPQEIEIFVNLMNGANSRMNIAADADGTTLRYGADGINPNAISAENVTGPDADVFPQGIGNIVLFGGTGPDTIGAQGGAGTGNPRTDPVEIEGGTGVDRLTGGEGGDGLGGEGGNDILSGVG